MMLNHTVCKSAAVPILAAPLGLFPLVTERGLVKRILTPVRLVLGLEGPEAAREVNTGDYHIRPSPQLILAMGKVTGVPELTEVSLPELFAKCRLVKRVLRDDLLLPAAADLLLAVGEGALVPVAAAPSL